MRGKVLPWALVVMASAFLGACASIPTDGPVRVGTGEVPFDEDLYPIPPRVPEDDPERLVLGFIAASAAGVAGDFSEERRYLVQEAASEWDPFAVTTVYGSGDVVSYFDPDALSVTVTIPLAATVDPLGRMTEFEEGATRVYVFGVASVSPGRWRISSLDDGIILSEASFSLVFRAVPLAFGARDDKVAVPDLRWLPRRNTATYATLALLGGPRPWLADAVVTGFDPTAELAVKAVPVEDGVAEVAFLEGSAGGIADRALAYRQLVATLTQIPGVAAVEATLGGIPLGGDAVMLEAPPVPSSQAAAIVDGRLGVWRGEEVLVVDGGGALPSNAREVALSYDGLSIALVLGGGQVVTGVLPDGLVPLDRAGAPSTALGLTVVWQGENLVAPSYDRAGWLWTAEAEGEGVLHAMGPAGEHAAFAVPGLAGRDIGGISVSHDGVRIAILSQEGGVWRLEIAGIVRAEDGSPLTVGVPEEIGTGIGPSRSVTWVDERIVAVLGTAQEGEAPTIRLVTVGGRTEVLAAIADTVDLTARNGVGSIALVTADGSLYVRLNAQWSRVVPQAGIESLAFSG